MVDQAGDGFAGGGDIAVLFSILNCLFFFLSLKKKKKQDKTRVMD